MAAKARGFDEFGDVFGEAKPEPRLSTADSVPPHRLLFRACSAAGEQHSRLRLVATDFHSLTWDRSLSVAELDDLRDDVGIGGSWSEFVNYLKVSLSAGEVKLIFGGEQDYDSGLSHAKLVATKAKGLPRITISLDRVTGSAANDAIANFSVALYTVYRNTQEDALKEQERALQLMGSLSSEREKNEILQKQLEALSFLNKRKATKPKLVADQVPSVCDAIPSSSISDAIPSSSVSDAIPSSGQVIAPVQQQPSAASPSNASPAKVTKRVAPVSRRARVRGALLQDTEDNDDI